MTFSEAISLSISKGYQITHKDWGNESIHYDMKLHDFRDSTFKEFDISMITNSYKNNFCDRVSYLSYGWYVF